MLSVSELWCWEFFHTYKLASHLGLPAAVHNGAVALVSHLIGFVSCGKLLPFQPLEQVYQNRLEICNARYGQSECHSSFFYPVLEFFFPWLLFV